MNIDSKRNAVKNLIANGVRRKRALEIVGVTEKDFSTIRTKPRKKYAVKKYSATIVKPWRCPRCMKLIQIKECLYCRDRKSLKLKGVKT